MVSRAYDAAPVGLCYLNRTFHYCEINDWLARINGVSVEEHLGRTIYEVIPDVARDIVEQLERVAETRDPLLNGRVVARTPAHPTEERTYEHNFLPDIGPGNIVLGFNIVVWDVTERPAGDNRQALSAARKVNELRPRDASPRPCSSLEEVEREHIVAVLEECGWRIRGDGGAADRLGLKRTTLQSRMKKLRIVRPRA